MSFESHVPKLTGGHSAVVAKTQTPPIPLPSAANLTALSLLYRLPRSVLSLNRRSRVLAASSPAGDQHSRSSRHARTHTYTRWYGLWTGNQNIGSKNSQAPKPPSSYVGNSAPWRDNNNRDRKQPPHVGACCCCSCCKMKHLFLSAESIFPYILYRRVLPRCVCVITAAEAAHSGVEYSVQNWFWRRICEHSQSQSTKEIITATVRLYFLLLCVQRAPS
jgi:hypothetical protein